MKRSPNPATAWGCLCTALLFATTWLFYTDLSVRVDSLLAVRLLKPLGDAALFMLPYWLLRGKWRGTALIPLWGLSAMYMTDVQYYRFNGDTMPLILLMQAGNADTPLIDSALALLQPSDFVYLLCPLAATALWCVRPVRRAVVSAGMARRERIWSICVTTLVVTAAQVAHSKAFARDIYFANGSHVPLAEATRQRLFNIEGFCVHSYALRCSGVPVYMFTELRNMLVLGGDITLTPAERAGFDAYLHRETACDSAAQRAGNIVFVVVESLNAEAIGARVGDEAVTPVLDSIIAAAGTMSSLHVMPQVSDGVSADGQLLYNLGTLPLLNGVAAQSAIHGKKLPTMAAALAATHYPVALFAESGRTWNEREVYAAYGYRRILTSDSVATRFDIDAMGNDEATMAYAVEVMPTLPQPFYMQILTISTHYPFRPKTAADFKGGDINGIERDYLRCVRYADAAIGRLVKGLPDSTLLVIASDHHMNMHGGLVPPRPIVFIAANCGRTERIEVPVSQADVFPTVLDMAGARQKWRGVGHSMLGARRGESDPRQATASDSLLRSDYFQPSR